MAFIRKHRVVLVPLFVVILGTVGLLFLLHSKSEEPGGNVSSAYPRETVQAWQEDPLRRTQHGREYRFVRTVEYVDPETEQVVTEESVSTVRERATNACYKDAAGKWQPTVPEWETNGLGFKMDKNSWQIEVPLTLGSVYEYTVGGKTLAMRPKVIGLSDGQHTTVLGQIDASVIGQIDESDPSKLVFADALGAGSGVDIELVLERASLHQNVVLRAKPALPEGFNAENTRLYVYTELGLDALTARHEVNVRVGDTPVNVSASDLETARNTSDPITFTVEKTVNGRIQEETLHRFVASRVWDETGPENEAVAARQLWRSPVDSKTYLVESLPHSYIADATGVVTLDYESQNGTMDEDETWTADATYYVTGDVVIGAGKTLTIEPGTVVKFAEDTQINAGIYETESGAKVIAKGEAYNYIVFTSDTDDNCGEDLTPGESTSGTSSYYRVAVEVGYHGNDDSEIEYCKAAFGIWGLVTAGRIDTPIAHCIAADCWCGILACRGDSDSASDVFNCLATDSHLGLCAWVRGENRPDEFSFTNNTVDGCTYGIFLTLEDESGDDPIMNVKNNLLTGCAAAGIARNGNGTGGTWNIDYNGFWDNEENYDGGISGGANDVVLDVSPYDGDEGYNDSPLGAYFVDTTDVGGPNVIDGSNLVDEGSAGFTTLYGSGAQCDITAPEAIEDDIASDTTWAKRAVDTGTVDIGYHHPRVDYVIDDTDVEIGSSSDVTLTINPGVVVAFSGSDSTLQFNPSASGDATLVCDGDPDDYIVMAGAPSVSMDIEAQRAGSSDGALRQDGASGASASVTLCRFVRLNTGFGATESSVDEVEHCVFEGCGKGVYAVPYPSPEYSITLDTCLFHDNDTGCCLVFYYGSMKSATLRNCTFDGGNSGLRYYQGYAYNKSLLVNDCLFTNSSTAGIWLECGMPNAYEEDHNAFWACDANVQIGSSPGSIGANSIVLLADPYDPDWFDAENPGSANWRAQWYLRQDDDFKSECVDGGSQSADDAGLSLFTTKLDASNVWLDVGPVDIGYHYDPDYGDASAVTISNIYCTNDQGGNQLSISVTLDQSWAWRIEIFALTDLETPIRTVDGSGQAISWTWYGKNDGGQYVDDGTYLVVISAQNGTDFEPFRFYVYLDNEDPAIAIMFPEDGAVVLGF